MSDNYNNKSCCGVEEITNKSTRRAVVWRRGRLNADENHDEMATLLKVNYQEVRQDVETIGSYIHRSDVLRVSYVCVYVCAQVFVWLTSLYANANRRRLRAAQFYKDFKLAGIFELALMIYDDLQ